MLVECQHFDLMILIQYWILYVALCVRVPLRIVSLHFAKNQLIMKLTDSFIHNEIKYNKINNGCDTSQKNEQECLSNFKKMLISNQVTSTLCFVRYLPVNYFYFLLSPLSPFLACYSSVILEKTYQEYFITVTVKQWQN